MESVDYLQFVNGNAQRADQNLASLTQALQYRQQKEHEAKLDEANALATQQQRSLADLQINDARAKQGALMQQYGTGDLAQAYASQAKEERGTKAAEIVMKNAKDIAAMGDPKGAIDYFNQQTGAKLSYQGHKDDFIQVKDETSGRMAAYNWRTGETKEIAQVTPKPNAEALMDKRFENQQALQAQQIAAADRRSAAQIAASDRRAAQQISAAERRAAMKENKGGQGKILPATQLESIADMKRVKDVLAEANQELQKGTVSTGPIAGRLQSVGAKVGLASDDFVNLQQKLQTAQNIMLKLRSGAAVTESEYARFLKEYPTPNDTPAVRDRKMQNTINYATTLMDEKMGIYEEGGYRVPQSVKSTNAKPAPAAPAGKKRPLPKF